MVVKEYMDKRSGDRNVNGQLQVQLEEDGASSTRENWMDIKWISQFVILSGAWSMLH